jgi:type IV secretion system protein VirB4
MRDAALIAREIESDVYLPFGRHVTGTVISLSTRALITVIRIDGTSFETAEAADLNDLHAKLNLTLRNIADDRLALWSHLVRRQTSDYPSGTFRSTFSAALDAQYRERLRSAALFRNDLYLTLVWHPGRATTDTAAAFFKRLGRASGRFVEVDSEALKRLDDATRDVVAALERYDARDVGLVDRDGIVFSEPMELLHAVTSGEWMPMPLPQGPIGPTLYSNRIIFGREALEIRSAGGSRFAGMFGIKEYPASTRPGLLNALLSAPFELILTQSFAFLSKADAKTVLTRKQNQLVSAQDPAASQIDELSDALDDLESNRFALGDHHLSLLVYANTPGHLQGHMSVVRRALADAGAVVAREDLGLEAAYWAQLPGLFKYRARAGTISSRNFAAFSPFHHLSGRKGRRQPLGTGSCDAQDRVRLAVLLFVPSRRPRQYLRLRPVGIRQNRRSEFPAVAGRAARRNLCLLRQGPRRRDFRPCGRRHLSDAPQRRPNRLRAAQGAGAHTSEPLLPGRTGREARYTREPSPDRH